MPIDFSFNENSTIIYFIISNLLVAEMMFIILGDVFVKTHDSLRNPNFTAPNPILKKT
ncbi:hypothetical protein LX77_00564 [Gelidibacter algens]|uniref:Uncharacterized protein n=1 Tax=Gelidibacter algens TaxID=49280 RepID=A0A327SFX9_9FLAO|nr:hypothetical protein LX77_00564 [Gelidibacter algens]